MPEKNFRSIRKRNSPPVVRVSEALAHYYASVNFKKLAVSTKTNYTHFLETFASWCATHTMEQQRDKTWQAAKSDEGIALHQIDDQVVFAFLEHIKTTHTPNPGRTEIADWTLATYVKCIKLFLNWCVLDEQYTSQVQAIVVQRIQMPTIEQEVIETFTAEQLKDLFAACEKEESEHLRKRDVAILSLLIETGIRAEELTLTTIGDMHLGKDPHIRIPAVNAKGGSGGEMGLGKDAQRAIRQYVEDFREPSIEHAFKRMRPNLPKRQYDQELKAAIASAPLFVSRYGEPLTRDGLRQVIKRLGEWAGIEGVRCTPHDFRHTFSLMFIENGGNIFDLQRILRHKSIKTTENYLRNLKQSVVRKRAKSVLDELNHL